MQFQSLPHHQRADGSAFVLELPLLGYRVGSKVPLVVAIGVVNVECVLVLLTSCCKTFLGCLKKEEKHVRLV